MLGEKTDLLTIEVWNRVHGENRGLLSWDGRNRHCLSLFWQRMTIRGRGKTDPWLSRRGEGTAVTIRVRCFRSLIEAERLSMRKEVAPSLFKER